jgi:hypothetical protein
VFSSLSVSTTISFFATSTTATPLSLSILESFSSDFSTNLTLLSVSDLFLDDLQSADTIQLIKNTHAFNPANSYKLQLSNIHPSKAG